MTIEVTITNKMETAIREEWLRVCKMRDDGSYYETHETEEGIIFKKKKSHRILKPCAHPYFMRVNGYGGNYWFSETRYFEAIRDLHLHCFSVRDVVLTGNMEDIYNRISLGVE